MIIIPPRLLTRRAGSGFGFRSMPDGPPGGVGRSGRWAVAAPGFVPIGLRSSAISDPLPPRPRQRQAFAA